MLKWALSVLRALFDVFVGGDRLTLQKEDVAFIHLMRIRANSQKTLRNCSGTISCAISKYQFNSLDEDRSRREIIFMHKFDGFCKSAPSGLLASKHNIKNPDEWNMNSLLSAHRIDNIDYMDPRVLSGGGVVRLGSLQSLWRNLDDSAVGGLSWDKKNYKNRDIEKLFAELDLPSVSNEGEFQQGLTRLLQILQVEAGLKPKYPRLNLNLASGGFLSRRQCINDEVDQTIPACIFGRCDWLLMSSKKGETEVACVCELKYNRKLKRNEKELFEDEDALPAQTWCSGIGSGSKRFFGLSEKGCKIFWVEKDSDFIPAKPDGPQERIIIKMWPSGPHMADFKLREHRAVFIRFMYGVARASGLLMSHHIDPDDDDQGADSPYFTDKESCDENYKKPNVRSPESPKTIKKKIKVSTQPQKPTRTVLVKAQSSSDDVLMAVVDVKKLARSVKDALERISTELSDFQKGSLDDCF